MNYRILLVDDHAVLRDGLKALLEKEPDLTVVAEAGTGQEAINCARECEPDVIIMDLTMPNMSGVEASRAILKNNPNANIIILSMVLDQECVSAVFKSGIKGYVLKDCASSELITAIRSVNSGFPYLSRQVTALVMQGYITEADKSASPLSKREQEVLALVAEGKNVKEIAYILGISAKTVEAQRLSVMNKLNIYSIAELTKYALRERLTSL
jgi:DNA-binding NarL/FixJ family response regulator